MSKKTRNRSLPQPRKGGRDTELRIIGGSHRGRKFRYHGDPGTRPMKERVREAIFNLLGPRMDGKHAVDLFGGTGALGFEAISRGASAATMIERHFPTARLIRQNAAALELDDKVTVLEGDAFFFAKNLPLDDASPWVIFCSPPYDLYLTQTEELMQLLRHLIASAPKSSLIVVESDERFDGQLLPQPDAWDLRVYHPAQVALAELPLPDGP